METSGKEDAVIGAKSERLSDRVLREKTWSERGLEEKVELLRGAICSLSREVDSEGRRVNALTKHVHVDGKIHVPYADGVERPEASLPYWAWQLK